MTVPTCALLDSSSDRSFCMRRLAREDGAEWRIIQLSLATLAPKIHRERTAEVDLDVVSTGLRHNWTILVTGVVVVHTLPTTLKETVATAEDLRAWGHLRDLNVSPWQDQGTKEVELLLGQDVPQALMPLEVRRGMNGALFAVWTSLGWTINDPVRNAEVEDQTSCSSTISVSTDT